VLAVVVLRFLPPAESLSNVLSRSASFSSVKSRKVLFLPFPFPLRTNRVGQISIILPTIALLPLATERPGVHVLFIKDNYLILPFPSPSTAYVESDCDRVSVWKGSE
jgi:hypothetical protein